MFNFSRLKTPHLFPLRHAALMSAVFAFATVLVWLVQAIPTHSYASSLAFIVVTGVLSVALGTFSTAMTRAKFNLIQTGRVIQWLGFWLATSISVGLSSYLFADNASVASSLLNGGAIFACSFAFAYGIKEIPWRGRTWLPMRRKY